MKKRNCIFIICVSCFVSASAQKVALEKYDLRRSGGEILFAGAEERILKDEQKLKDKVLTVADDTMTIEGAGSHDYMSVAPYWFDNGAGVWEKKDGVRNADVNQWEDKKDMNRLVREVSLLALAERVHSIKGEAGKAYAAAERLNKRLLWWFVDEETRMAPNMKYAQFVPGKGRDGKVRGSGIVELRVMMDLIESLEIVEADGRMDAELKKAVRKWFAEMVEWMLTSPQGQKERSAKNNHGTWYDAQVIMCSAFFGKTSVAKEFEKELRQRIMDQIDENGVQKYEMARTKSLSYCCFNLLAYSYCKDALRKCGVDVEKWKEWERVKKAAKVVEEYALRDGKGWDGSQITPFERREWSIIGR